MPFSPLNLPVPTPQQSNPFADLLKNAMSSYQNAVSTKYQPRMLEADIFSKQFAPLAQMVASPMFQAMAPEQQRSMAQLISQLLNQNKNLVGNDGTQAGATNAFEQLYGNSNEKQNNQNSLGTNSTGKSISDAIASNKPNSPQTDKDYNPSLPQAGKSFGTGASAKTIAGSQSQVHEGGSTFYDPGTDKQYGQPGQHTIETNIQGINAIKRVRPQLDAIANDSEEFTKSGSMFGTRLAQAAGTLSQYLPEGLITPAGERRFGIDPDKVTRYAKFEADKTQAAKDLMDAFPNLAQSDQTLNYIRSLLEPIRGETTGFKERVLSQLAKLDQRSMALKQQMKPVAFTGDEGNQEDVKNPSTDEGGYTAEKFLSGKFKNDNEFVAAFKTLSPELRKQVRALMKQKGYK